MTDAPADLQDLIDEYLSGVIGADRMAALDARLTADPAARRYFVRYSQMHTNVALELAARAAGEQSLARLAPETGADRPRRRARWAVRGAVAAAVLVGVAAAVAWRAGGPGPTDGPPGADVAWLVNARDCRWADGAGPDGGMRPGRVLRLESGLAEVRFRRGATVVLEGPAGLELLSDNAARLARGRLAARVPEGAKGFQLFAPSGRVVDLGTEFGAAVGDDGVARVFVFAGEVRAFGPNQPGGGLELRERQAARIGPGGVAVEAGDGGRGFVRSLVTRPATKALDFGRPAPGTLADAAGLGTGFTHRLPGTGAALPAADPHLRLDAGAGRFELTTTESDLNTQYKLHQAEFPGFRLADLGFTGAEDFEITATLTDIPALKAVGQFGLYAGAAGDAAVRGGLVGQKDSDQYRQFLVNTRGGRDTNAFFVGLVSAGNDLRMTLARRGGKYGLTIEDLTTGSSSTLGIAHPDHLDGRPDLYAGLYAANPRNKDHKPITFTRVAATVWAASAKP